MPPWYEPTLGRAARQSSGGSYTGNIGNDAGIPFVSGRLPAYLGSTGASVAVLLAGIPGTTDLAQESPIIWVITGLSVGGAVITFAFLVYGVLRFRDPKVKGRRYG